MRKSKIKKVIPQQEIPTGSFSSWLRETRKAQASKTEAIVPCGECRACCTSSYFIHIRPDETATLARIPKELLFPAPGLPQGNVLLGYDENGHCPMFSANRCSIYAHRPQTCRTYDCRVFAATGLPAGEDKPLITQQAQRWKFDFPTRRDHKQLAAVRAAAKFLREQAACFPAGFVPSNTTQQAALAIKVYEVFVDFTQARKDGEDAEQNHKIAKAVMEAYEKFERG